LKKLGAVCDATGGKVNRVDPLSLTKEFSSVLEDKIIATEVSATLSLNRRLHFLSVDSDDSTTVQNQSKGEDEFAHHKITKFLGNVTASTEITFEYSVQKDIEKNVNVSEPNKPSSDQSIPFQVQITYRPVGSRGGIQGAPPKMLRVVTCRKEVTKDRNVAEKSANVDVLATHFGQQAAQLAFQGKYTESRFKSYANKNF